MAMSQVYNKLRLVELKIIFIVVECSQKPFRPYGTKRFFDLNNLCAHNHALKGGGKHREATHDLVSSARIDHDFPVDKAH